MGRLTTMRRLQAPDERMPARGHDVLSLVPKSDSDARRARLSAAGAR